MGKITVKVKETKILEYDSELFQEHIDEIPMIAMCEFGAMCASKELIVLRNYESLSKFNDLMVSFLTKS